MIPAKTILVLLLAVVSCVAMVGCFKEQQTLSKPVFLKGKPSAKKVPMRTWDARSGTKLILDQKGRVLNGAEHWKNADDASAIAILNRLKGGLLVTVEVSDNTLVIGRENFFENDCVELYFDLRPARLANRDSYEKGVFKISLVPANGKDGKPRVDMFPEYEYMKLAGVEVSHEKCMRGYRVQVYFSKSWLQKEVFLPRKNFGFDFGIKDTDGNRKMKEMVWHGTLLNWAHPKDFGSVTPP